MPCNSCAHWIRARKTIYESGDEVFNFQAPEGKGHCDAIDLDTDPEFGCTKFDAEKPYLGVDDQPHVIVAHKSGAPWHYSVSGPCPDCAGKGNAGDTGCHRCAGTGKVRYYDDGYIGEERTRLHPKEREQAGKPKCADCGREVERAWKVCPACGHKLDAESPIEVIKDADAGLPI